MTRTTRGMAALVVVAALSGCTTTAPAASVSRPQPTTRPVDRHLSRSLPHPRRGAAVPTMRPPSDQRILQLVRTITGAISPKSVVATPGGSVFAQNMMYLHTVTVYRPSGLLRRTIPDAVRLSAYGVSGHPGLSHGAPVEAAVDPVRPDVYVSNYSMSGAGFGPEGSDVCSPRSAIAAGVTPSFVYRINRRTLRIDGVYGVGMVPKYLAVTPDGRYLLVSNWCSYTVTVIRLSTGRRVRTLHVGAYPRGIAVTPNSATAYVAVMGSTHLARIDLRRLRLGGTVPVGDSPRHVVMAPNGRHLFVSLNAESSVVKVDRRTGQVVGRAYTGRDPRSIALAPDGRTLYAVNYLSNTISVVRARDMAVLQTIATDDMPIGVTYDRVGNRVWVALYSGKILVFDARAP